MANLGKEIDATIKDDVSIYFDENTHDDLRETDDVDASLSGKLRCLILIPILAQTYCGQKSFAWKNEFVTFDQLGRHSYQSMFIKIKNADVTSLQMKETTAAIKEL